MDTPTIMVQERTQAVGQRRQTTTDELGSSGVVRNGINGIVQHLTYLFMLCPVGTLAFLRAVLHPCTSGASFVFLGEGGIVSRKYMHNMSTPKDGAACGKPDHCKTKICAPVGGLHASPGILQSSSNGVRSHARTYEGPIIHSQNLKLLCCQNENPRPIHS